MPVKPQLPQPTCTNYRLCLLILLITSSSCQVFYSGATAWGQEGFSEYSFMNPKSQPSNQGISSTIKVITVTVPASCIGGILYDTSGNPVPRVDGGSGGTPCGAPAIDTGDDSQSGNKSPSSSQSSSSSSSSTATAKVYTTPEGVIIPVDNSSSLNIGPSGPGVSSSPSSPASSSSSSSTSSRIVSSNPSSASPLGLSLGAIFYNGSPAGFGQDGSFISLNPLPMYMSGPSSNQPSSSSPSSSPSNPNIVLNSMLDPQVISKILSVPLNVVLDANMRLCTNPNEQFNGRMCVCQPGNVRNSTSKVCELLACPQFSTAVGTICVCQKGFTMKANMCIAQVNCAQDKGLLNNGIGSCVCTSINNFVNNAGNCQTLSEICPAHFYYGLNDKACQCELAVVNTLSQCSKCLVSEIWSNYTSKCQLKCLLNQYYSTQLSRCVCLDGLGLLNNKCVACPSGWVLKDLTCVRCPLNSVYSDLQRKCVCLSQFIRAADGTCLQPKCDTSMQQNVPTQQCICRPWFYPSGLVCVPCLQGFPCQLCPANAIYATGSCVCTNGFYMNLGGSCAKCEPSAGCRLNQGLPAFCPIQGMKFNSKGICVCPYGLSVVENKCVDVCSPDMKANSDGKCYRCPPAQIEISQVCSCQAGFTQAPGSSLCKAQCPTNMVLVNSLCTTCPQGTNYNSLVKGCVCPANTYHNRYGECQSMPIAQIDCGVNQYYRQFQGCLKCPTACATCSSSDNCITCKTVGFIALNGICVQNCGDGALVGREACDDGNKYSGDGCSVYCTVQPLFVCTMASPSVCTAVLPAVLPPWIPPYCGNGRLNAMQECDDGNKVDGNGCSSACLIEAGYTCSRQPSQCIPIPGSAPTLGLGSGRSAPALGSGSGGSTINQIQIGLTQDGSLSYNSHAIMIPLKVTPAFKFVSQGQVNAALSVTVASKPDSTSYSCLQNTTDFTKFVCLLQFSQQLTADRFTITVSYSRAATHSTLSITASPGDSGVANVVHV